MRVFILPSNGPRAILSFATDRCHIIEVTSAPLWQSHLWSSCQPGGQPLSPPFTPARPKQPSHPAATQAQLPWGSQSVPTATYFWDPWCPSRHLLSFYGPQFSPCVLEIIELPHLTGTPREENLIPHRLSVTCFDRSAMDSACFQQNILTIYTFNLYICMYAHACIWELFKTTTMLLYNVWFKLSTSPLLYACIRSRYFRNLLPKTLY